jgi:hypothetical protein
VPSITPSSLLAVLIPIVVIVLLLSCNLLQRSILTLPLRLGSCRLILWRITSEHAAFGQVFSSDLRRFPLTPQMILRILLIVLILLLGVVLTHAIVILGVLRLALFSFLITIVIEAIASTTLRGVKWAL